jgi:hypothetical protein
MQNDVFRGQADSISVPETLGPSPGVDDTVRVHHTSVAVSLSQAVVARVGLSGRPGLASVSVFASVVPLTHELGPGRGVQVTARSMVHPVSELSGVVRSVRPGQLPPSVHDVVSPFAVVRFGGPTLNAVAVPGSIPELSPILRYAVGFGEGPESVFHAVDVLSGVDASVEPALYAASVFLPLVAVSVVGGSVGPLEEYPSV